MQRRTILRSVFVCVFGGVLGAYPRAPIAQAEARYATAGRVVSIAPDLAAVSIAHDAIPGVMGAMTMSFSARAPSQLAGLAVGERVRFTFTVTDDGRRLLDSVRRGG